MLGVIVAMPFYLFQKSLGFPPPPPSSGCCSRFHLTLMILHRNLVNEEASSLFYLKTAHPAELWTDTRADAKPGYCGGGDTPLCAKERMGLY